MASRAIAVARPHRYVIVIAVLGALLLLELGAIALNRAYDGRAMPGTRVAGTSVGGLSAAEVEQRVTQFVPPSSVTVSYGTTDVTLDPAALGLHVDPARSADLALSSGRASSQIGTLFALGRGRSEQVVTGDEDALQRFLDEKFDGVLPQPTEPTVTYDPKAGSFVLHPSRPGERLSAAAVLGQLSLRWRVGQPVSVTAGTIATAPVTSDEDAAAARDAANRMIAHDLTIKAGSASATIPVETLATFVTVSKPDGEPMAVRPNTEAIAKYVNRTLRPRVESSRADTVRLTNAAGKATLTIPGATGRALGDSKDVTSAIAAAMTHEKQAVSVAATEQPGKTRTIKDGVRSVDINLTKQRLSLLVDGASVRSYVISSGKPSTPTVQGTFHVWHKTAMQDMSGGSGASAYVLKDVKWNSFFSGNYAFHTANWHNDFGTPVSHGCVNMREADAKAAYEFAPLGTKVTVHE